MQDTMERERDKMLKFGAVKQFSSPWASPVVLVEKKNEDVRFYVDFCKWQYNIQCLE